MKLWRFGCAIEKLDQRYRLDGLLGSGGMADVCLAWDEQEQREVAVKVLKADEMDQQTLARFRKEAAHIAPWRHPNILRIYSDLKAEQLNDPRNSAIPYIIMEYAKGGDLQKCLQTDVPYPLDSTLLLFSQLCSAVDYAHGQGIIHRDLKPSNILFRILPDGAEQMVLSDFGLAVTVDASHQTFRHAGTLPYMAPEHIRGKASPASDIFSLGVILYLLCTGKLPFQRTTRKISDSKLNCAPLPPSSIETSLPQALDDVVLTTLAPEPSRRYKSAKALWEALRTAIPTPLNIVQQESMDKVYPFSQDQLIAEKNISKSKTNDTYRRSMPAERHLSVRIYPQQADVTVAEPPLPEEASKIEKKPERELQHVSANAYLQYVLEDTQTNLTTPDRLPHTNQQVTSTTPFSSASNGSEGTANNHTNIAVLSPLAQTKTVVTTELANVPLHTPTTRRKKRNTFLLVGTILIIILLLAVGSLATFLGSHQNSLTSSHPTSIKKELSDTFTITAVPGSPDPTKHQIMAQLLTSQTLTQSVLVNATGNMQSQGTQAKGLLTFFNTDNEAQVVTAGTSFTGNSGARITIDQSVTIPAANNGIRGQISVPAHAVNVGAAGNIPAQDVNGGCCNDPGDPVTIFVQNPAAFTGGQNTRTYQFVVQTDVDTATKPVIQQLTQQAQRVLTQQVKPGETLEPDTQCTPRVQTNQPIGDTGQNIPSLIATVSALCTGFIYDQQALQDEGARLLQAEATQNFGNDYSLQGSIALTIKGVDINPDKSLSLHIRVNGIWISDHSLVNRTQ